MNKAAQSLGRLGGLAKSDAKAAAVRENGKLGGRPKKKKNWDKETWQYRAFGYLPGKSKRAAKTPN